MTIKSVHILFVYESNHEFRFDGTWLRSKLISLISIGFPNIYDFDFMPKKTCGSPWIDALPTRWGFETRLNLIWLQSVQSKIKPANNVDSMTRRKIENFLIDLQKITRVNILTPLHFGCRVLNFGKKYDCQNPITKKMLHWKFKTDRTSIIPTQ